MINIQENALNTYNKNLLFFKKSDQDLYSRIIALSNFISNGEYEERYHLEYIKEDDQFDIYDSNNDCYLYDKQPNRFIKKSVQDSNFDKINTINLLQSDLYNNTISLDNIEGIDLETKTTKIMLHDLKEYTTIFNKSTNDPVKKFKYIDKFIFIGTLLGTHILPIHNKLLAHTYLIYERNLEIFRLSLFTTKYYKLAKDNLVLFSIMDDDVEFNKKFVPYFKKNLQGNYQFKYYSTNYNIGNVFDKIVSFYSNNTAINYKYTKILEGLLKLNIKNIPNHLILKTKTVYSLFENNSVLILGAGPSILKNLNWIHEHRQNYTILAVGAIVKTLVNYNIIPDIITSVDSDIVVENQFPDDILPSIENIPFLASTATHPNILGKFKNIFMFEVMSTFKETSTLITGYSVGEVTLYLSSLLGANNIYMLGTDFALDQDTGSTHLSDHQDIVHYSMSAENLQDNYFVENKASNTQYITLPVKGNFKEKVITNITFQKSISIFHYITSWIYDINKNTKIYNLSDGAYLSNTIPLRINDVDTNSLAQSAKISSEDILKFLQNNSQIGFTKEDKHYLKNCTYAIDTLIGELNYIDNLKCKSYSQFIDQRENIFNFTITGLKEFERLHIDKMYYYYFLLTEPYFRYQFNDIEKIDVKIIKNIKKIWIKQLLRISNEYKQTLETVLV